MADIKVSMKSLIFLLTVLHASASFAADLKALSKLFKENYNTFYEYRRCGANVARLVEAAQTQGIDLRGAYPLEVRGAGFLETSGFYTRGDVDERVMLGYYHVVLVADGYVFDFDLARPLVLTLENYVRLQFTPPTAPYLVGGNIFYRPEKDLPWWRAIAYDTDGFTTTGAPKILWEKKLTELVDLERVLRLERRARTDL